MPLCKPGEIEGNGRRGKSVVSETFPKRDAGVRESVAFHPRAGGGGGKQSRERTKERNWDVTARTEKPRGRGAGEEPPPAGGEGWLHAWLAAAQKTLTQKSRLSLILPQDWGRGKSKGGANQKSREEGAFCFKGLPLGPVPNFLGFVPGLKGEVLCHP